MGITERDNQKKTMKTGKKAANQFRTLGPKKQKKHHSALCPHIQ